jgi:hypothetical protein
MLGWEVPVFLPIQIPLPYYVNRSETPFALFGKELPLSWLKEEYYRMEEIPVTLTREEAKEQAIRELLLVERTRFADAVVKDKSVTGELIGDEYHVKGEYVCEMEIGLQREILVRD